MDRVWIAVQGVLVGSVGTLLVLATGHSGGLAIALTETAGGTVWLTCAAAYYARRSQEWRAVWALDARLGLMTGSLGFGLPLAAGVLAWRSPGLEGLAFSTTAGTVGSVATAVVPCAALASSMVDRYLILPGLLGLLGRAPVWRAFPGKEHAGRRRLAQAWVIHRAVCEFFIFPAVALVLALVLVAATHRLSSDGTVTTAVDSLGGPSIAFGVFGFASPRWRDSLRFVLSAPVGLGYWIEGVDSDGRRVSGFVVDVSVDPGVKVVTRRGKRREIPLEKTRNSDVLERPSSVRDQWCRDQVLTHVLKLDAGSLAAWPGPPAQ